MIFLGGPFWRDLISPIIYVVSRTRFFRVCFGVCFWSYFPLNSNFFRRRFFDISPSRLSGRGNSFLSYISRRFCAGCFRKFAVVAFLRSPHTPEFRIYIEYAVQYFAQGTLENSRWWPSYDHRVIQSIESIQYAVQYFALGALENSR